MFFALPFYAGLFVYFYRKQDAPTRTEFNRDLGLIALVGLFGYYLASWFDFVGLEYVSAGFERLLLFIYPTLVLFISLVWLKIRPGKKEIIALAITYVGIGVAFRSEAQSSGPRAHIGALYIVGAAITYAVYLVATEKLSEKYSPLVFTSFAILVSAVVILLHAWVTGEKLLGYPAPVYWYALFMAIFCTVVPSLFVAQGIQYIGSNRASILSMIGPIMTIYMAYAFLGEEITWIQSIGTLCVIAGVTLLSVRKTKNASE